VSEISKLINGAPSKCWIRTDISSYEVIEEVNVVPPRNPGGNTDIYLYLSFFLNK
jgi:hypothetical protein